VSAERQYDALAVVVCLGAEAARRAKEIACSTGLSVAQVVAALAEEALLPGGDPPAPMARRAERG
jgi:hypothetical protein